MDFKKLICALFAFAAAIANASENRTANAPDSCGNFFGLAWGQSSPREMLRYCENVGHRHVMYKGGMENEKLADDIFFYIESPEYWTYRRGFDFEKTYSQKQIDEWEKMCVVVYPEKPFPHNMATGWFFSKTRTGFQLDMQQKRVHEIAIDRIMKNVKRITAKNPKLKFGGFCWDVPQPYGDFNYYNEKSKSLNRQTTLKHWTGKDSSPERDGIRHDYPTYFEGYFEFYRSLMKAARKENPQAKFIVEPYNIYGDWIKYFESDFMKSKGEKAKEYMADFIWQEGSSCAFASDARIFKNSVVSRDAVGNSSSSVFVERESRKVSASAAANGSWTAFFGRYGGYNIAPRAATIRDVPARIKLAKLVPVWENINNTPLSQRRYDGEVYGSPTAFMSGDVYWAIQPQKNRIIFIFITERGEVKIPDGWKIEKVSHLDGIFSECGTVDDNVLKISGNSIKPDGGYLSNWAFSAKLKKIKK